VSDRPTTDLDPDDPDDDPRPWYEKPAALAGMAVAVLILLGVLAVLVLGGDDDEPATTTTSTSTTTTTTSSTTSTTTSTTTTTTTTAPPATTVPPTTAAPALVPGDPCTLGSDNDCIDPDGDGQGSYLIDGGDCISVRPDPADCADFDGDGVAGGPTP
jgi:hypothetical protein